MTRLSSGRQEQVARQAHRGRDPLQPNCIAEALRRATRPWPNGLAQRHRTRALCRVSHCLTAGTRANVVGGHAVADGLQALVVK